MSESEPEPERGEQRFGIWCGGRWRRVDPVSGRVEGWRRPARFLRLRLGAAAGSESSEADYFELLSARRVLAALRALARGRPSSVRLGPPVPALPEEPRRPTTLTSRGVQTEVSAAGRDRRLSAHKAAQTSPPWAAREPPPWPVSPAKRNECTSPAKRNALLSPHKRKTSPINRQSSLSPAKRKRAPTSGESTGDARESSSQEESQCSVAGGEGGVELVMSEAEVALVRSRLTELLPGADPRRFDTDDRYKVRVLFGACPVVRVARCPLVARLLRRAPPPPPPPPAVLSLLSSSGDSDGDFRRPILALHHRSSRGKSRAGAGAGAGAGGRRSPRARGPPRQRRSCVPAGREYSALEDQAIVAWLGADPARERRVNGNRVWLDLQDNHPRLTGVRRTWHSLRNRYLRYILPALPRLALSAAHAQRLRAAAAAGSLKSRKLRRNSIFSATTVRGASSRRPPPPLPPDRSDDGSDREEHRGATPPPRRSLRDGRGGVASRAPPPPPAPPTRYSFVSRRARGPAPSASPAGSAAPSPESPAARADPGPEPAPGTKRRRRLYNP